MTPNISVVIPLYNCAPYIEQCIRSFLAQTRQDVELIVVDDGSTDDGFYKATALLRHGTDHWIHQRNGGTGSALNVGFQLARGDYQTWFSADNWAEPNFLECLAESLDYNPDVGFVYSDFWVAKGEQTALVKAPEFNRRLLRQRCYVGQIWMWRRWVKEQAGEFQLEPCEDWDMWIRMSEITDFKHVSKPLGYWRDRPGSITNTVNADGKYSQFVLEKHWGKV